MKGREMRIGQEVPVSWPQPLLELSRPAKGTVLGTQCQPWMAGSEEFSMQASSGAAATSLGPLGPRARGNPSS